MKTDNIHVLCCKSCEEVMPRMRGYKIWACENFDCDSAGILTTSGLTQGDQVAYPDGTIIRKRIERERDHKEIPLYDTLAEGVFSDTFFTKKP